jgi:hypothetical protein
MSLSSQTLIKMGFQQHRPTITYEDFEAAAVELSKETRSGSALRWHFIAERQSTQVDDLTVVNRRRNKVIAGFLVSPRAAPTLDAFHDHILGHNPRSWLMTTSKTLSSVSSENTHKDDNEVNNVITPKEKQKVIKPMAFQKVTIFCKSKPDWQEFRHALRYVACMKEYNSKTHEHGYRVLAYANNYMKASGWLNYFRQQSSRN